MSFNASIRPRPFSKKYPFSVVVSIERLFRGRKEAQRYLKELRCFDERFEEVKK